MSFYRHIWLYWNNHNHDILLTYKLEHRIPMCLQFLFVCLFIYVLATSKVISGPVVNWDSAHSWQLYSAASLEHQTAGTMTCHPNSIILSWHWVNQSLLIMPRSDATKRHFYQYLSLWCDSTRFGSCRLWIRTHDLRISRSPRTGGGVHMAAPSLHDSTCWTGWKQCLKLVVLVTCSTSCR